MNVKSGGLDDKVVINAQNFKAKEGLCQIPQEQITLSDGVLVQNDGWK